MQLYELDEQQVERIERLLVYEMLSSLIDDVELIIILDEIVEVDVQDNIELLHNALDDEVVLVQIERVIDVIDIWVLGLEQGESDCFDIDEVELELVSHLYVKQIEVELEDALTIELILMLVDIEDEEVEIIVSIILDVDIIDLYR